MRRPLHIALRQHNVYTRQDVCSVINERLCITYTHIGNVRLDGLSCSLQQSFGQIVCLLVEILQNKSYERTSNVRFLYLPTMLLRGRPYLVSRNQVYQNSIQKFLRDGVTFADNRAHEIHHMHVDLLVVAIAIQNKQQEIGKHKQALAQNHEMIKE